ncbi:hypothetical protein [Sodalinema gerasimenkoae]|uniref:hypothetical protein n=1 Tax=Sodalinema gerasimenkoae TaxID=2862348 RepID=UPI001358129E|nr:hypothetical protein [Sodalinema gerasimenkoae]
MIQLKITQTLTHCLRLLIPTTVDGNQPIDTADLVRQINQDLCSFCGGTLCKQHRGYYQSDTLGLVEEVIYEIEVWTTEFGLKQVEPHLQGWIRKILVDLRQESVLVMMDGQALLWEVSKGDILSQKPTPNPVFSGHEKRVAYHYPKGSIT